jgi:hypothetical protein
MDLHGLLQGQLYLYRLYVGLFDEIFSSYIIPTEFDHGGITEGAAFVRRNLRVGRAFALHSHIHYIYAKANILWWTE